MENAAAKSEARPRLTWQEICRLYPDEWVLMIEPEWEEDDEDSGALLSAIVLGHSKDRGGCIRDTRAIRDQENILSDVHWYTGRVRERPFGFRL